MGKRWILIGVSVCILLLLLLRGVLLELNERRESQLEEEYGAEQEVVPPEEDMEREWILRNVWVQENGAQSVRFLGPDGWEERETQTELSVEIKGEVVDLYGQGDMIQRIVRKPERITGRVLLVDEESGELELEGYEPLTLDENVQVYDLRDESGQQDVDEPGEVTRGSISQIVLGYGAADYVVAEGRVCAVLICREIVPEDIRVLIKTTGYGEVYHESIRLNYQGETITIKPGSDRLEEGRCVLTDPDGIRVESVERSLGHPVYQGSLEIQETPQGLLLINEVDLETYLKGVLPSEMPSSFPEAALQAQAVCARSYALRQLMEGGCRRYGAHVDDSVSYQAYQNVASTEKTDAAVKKTEGQVLLWEGEPALTSYFSTSYGMTSPAHKVWIGMDELPYLIGRLQAEQESAGEAMKEEMDLSSEKAFRTFLLEKDDAYEAAVSWYRWKTTVSAAHLKKSIDSTLLSRYRATPELIRTWQGGKYVSVPVDTVGQVEEIRITRRETEGLVTEIEIRGSKNQVRIGGEYNIRTVLAPIWDSVIRKDGSEISGSAMLPSAYILLEEEREEGELVSVTIRGGGYGHGVGMSQYGAKTLAESGMKYKKILSHYYPGTELKFLY